MLSRSINKARSKGISLVEIMVVIVIVGVLMAIAIPSYRVWMQNSQIRNAAESVLTGMQLARNEAVRRNTRMKFQLDSTEGSWRICFPNPADGNCGDPTDPAAIPDVQAHTVTNASTNVRLGVLRQSDVTLTFSSPLGTDLNIPASIIFDSFGRTVPTDTIDDIVRVDVLNSTLSSTDQRRLVIVVSPTGAMRMCDPQLPTTTPKNPQAC